MLPRLALPGQKAPAAAGYKMHYGNYSGSYQYTVNVGNSTSCTISGLNEGTTYYFAATAYDTQQNESGYSNEVTYYISYKGSQQPVDEIIGTWSTGIWYWDEASSRWTKMNSSAPPEQLQRGILPVTVRLTLPQAGIAAYGIRMALPSVGKKFPVKLLISMTAGDITGDGRAEIIGTWGSWHLVSGSGQFKLDKNDFRYPSGDIAAGDFTGDGKADVASSWIVAYGIRTELPSSWKKVYEYSSL